MNEILGTSVTIDVTLDGWHLSDKGIGAKSTIQAPSEVDDRIEHDKLNEGPESLRSHSAHDSGTNSLVPRNREIGFSSDEEDERKRTSAAVEVFKARIVENDEDGGVDELAYENGDHGVVGL